jgi:hypothetical protein
LEEAAIRAEKEAQLLDEYKKKYREQKARERRNDLEKSMKK